MGATDAEERPSVLVVEDEEKVRQTYQLWLTDEYDLTMAADGQEALDLLEAGEVDPDVVLLDRLMPGLSGKETLARMRDRETDARFAMVTAVEPDFDIIEMGFDAYVNKPVEEAELKQTLAELRSQSDYEDALDEYTSLLAKREALKAKKPQEELEGSEKYQRLVKRLEELETELDDTGAHANGEASFVATLRGIDESAEKG